MVQRGPVAEMAPMETLHKFPPEPRWGILLKGG